jgi:RHS repeat-associated protein
MIYGYDPVTGLMTAADSEFATANVTADPDNSITKTYTRDAFGNVTDVQNATGAPGLRWYEPRTASTGYNAQGRFALTATNAMGHVETRTFDGKTGAPLTLTGPNGLTTTWTYDGFGRKILETRADGTKTQFTYGYCTALPAGVDACPANATTLLATQQLDTAGAKMSAQSVSYLDRLGREIRVTSEGMKPDGSVGLNIVDTIYDAKGRLLKKSEPYFKGTAATAIVWRAYEYEALGRTKTEFHSVLGDDVNGKKRVSFTYEGLTKTAVTSRDDGIISGLQARMAPTTETRITRLNSQGQEVEITDSIGGKTNFAYDPQGKLTQTIVTAADATGAPVSITTSISYDKLGNKVAMSDPDKGNWTYVVDPLGQVRQQTDAKGNKTDIYYDKLGRVLAKIVGRSDSTTERTDYWAYDTGDKATGKLIATASVDGNGTVFAQRGFAFDSLGRLQSASQAFDGQAAQIQVATYTATTGRLATVQYPSGLTLGYEYNAIGEMVKVKNAVTNLAYWTGEGRNAAGQLVKSLAGNGVRTTRTYAASRGFLTGISSVNAAGESIQDLQYGWDNFGNMLYREVDTLNGGYREDFDYDDLNRLSGSTITSGPVAGNPDVSVTIGYDGFGNIISKSDKGTYGYSFAAGQKPHAVAEVVGPGGVNTESYQYDLNGNMSLSVLNGGTTVVRSVSWTGFNQPLSIKRGGTLGLDFAYDGEQSRIKQVNHLQSGQTKYYYGDAMGNNRSERVVTAVDAVWTDQVLIGGEMVATVVTPESTMLQQVRYMHTDHLGSIQAVTDSMSVKIESLDYDAWGARRSGGTVIGVTATGLQGQPDLGQAIAGKKTDRGFTGHEMLDDVGLIHMNGRIYDAQLARFLAADNFVQDPKDSQSYSRYSYVRNSPLTATDPSGWMENAQVEDDPSTSSPAVDGQGEIAHMNAAQMNKSPAAGDTTKEDWFASSWLGRGLTALSKGIADFLGVPDYARNPMDAGYSLQEIRERVANRIADQMMAEAMAGARAVMTGSSLLSMAGYSIGWMAEFLGIKEIPTLSFVTTDLGLSVNGIPTWRGYFQLSAPSILGGIVVQTVQYALTVTIGEFSFSRNKTYTELFAISPGQTVPTATAQGWPTPPGLDYIAVDLFSPGIRADLNPTNMKGSWSVKTEATYLEGVSIPDNFMKQHPDTFAKDLYSTSGMANFDRSTASNYVNRDWGWKW